MADQRARRVKDLLSSYYGNADDITVVDDSQGSNWPRPNVLRSSQAKDLNSKDFDHDRYVTSLISESTLEDLLQKHLSWSAEIKNLDGDMQMLVYENYNKFISATDTISKMKTNVDAIESDMEKLSNALSELQSQSDKVTSSLSGRREKIEELNGTRSLLRKVQFIFDLPRRLRGYIEAEDFSSAVKAYVGSQPVLESYGEASFLQCRDECQAIIENLISTLKSRVLSASDLSSAMRAESAVLLSQLSVPIEDLMAHFIQAHGEALKAALHQNDQDFPSKFETFALEFRQVFPMGERRLCEATKDIFHDFFTSLQRAVSEESKIPEGDSATHLCSLLSRLSWSAHSVAELIPGAELLERSGSASASALTEFSMRAFASLSLSLEDMLFSTHQLPPATSPLPLSSPLRSPLRSPLPQPLPLQSSLESAHRTLVQGCLTILRDVRALVESSSAVLGQWRRELVVMLHSELEKLFSTLSLKCSQYALKNLPLFAPISPQNVPQSPTKLGPKSPSHLLVLAKFCQVIGPTALPRVELFLQTVFSPLAAVSPHNSPQSFPQMEAVGKELQNTAEELLQKYVDCKVCQLSVSIRTAVESSDWLAPEDPKEISSIADLLLSLVFSMEEEVDQLLPPGADRSLSFHRTGTAESAASLARGGLSSTGIGPTGVASETPSVATGRTSSRGPPKGGRSLLLERDVAKLFSEKIQLTGKLEFNQAWVVSTVVKLSLKTFQESIRLQTLSRSGFRQIQLDCAFLRDPLRSYMDDEGSVDQLLDEVCVAAAERCFDPSPLEPSLVIEMIQSHASKFSQDVQG